MAKSLADLRKLQKTQFAGVTKQEIVDAILAAGEDDATNTNEKLDKIARELTELRAIITASESESKAKIKELTEVVTKQSEIILQHQLFLEQLDRRNREKNLVLFGVPDENLALEGATTENAKIEAVFEAIGADSSVICSHNRLGKEQKNNRPRPLLVKVDSKFIRDQVIDKAQKLKDLDEPLKKVYIKKDSHPEVRKEWKRLKDAEQNEKVKNPGSTIRLDYKKRVLIKDDIEIDKWTPHPF